MCVVSKAQKEQKRFFMITLWPGHVGMNWPEGTPDKPPREGNDDWDEELFKERLRFWWDSMAIPEVTYRVGQMEVDDNGQLHGQIAVKTARSVRAVTMMRKHSGHWEPARNPAAVYNYVQKTEGRIEFLGEDGTKPAGGRTEGHGSSKRRAIRMLVQDKLTPEQIAATDPEAYFTHHRAIDRLWERLNPDAGVGKT